jgi:glycine cleavage system H lipoate-binding protein
MNDNESKPKQNYRRLIPESEYPCIWMDVGSIAFKLCDHLFDCDHCPFDDAMRSLYSNPSEQNLPPPIDEKKTNTQDLSKVLEEYLPFRQPVQKDIYYNPQYTWVEQTNTTNFKVGLDPFLLYMLGHVDVIVLPIVGTPIHKGEYFCWLFGDYPPLPVVAPANGVVTRVNAEVRWKPEILFRKSEQNVWLAEITSAEFEKDKQDLLIDNQSLDWRENQIKILKNKFSQALEENYKKIGVTMQDGGPHLTQIKDILGKKKYYDIIFRYLKTMDEVKNKG